MQLHERMKTTDYSTGRKVEVRFSLTHWILGITWDTVSLFDGMVRFVAVHIGPWSVIITRPL